MEDKKKPYRSMNFELPRMARLQRQNRMILAIDLSKQESKPCCVRFGRGLSNKLGVLIRDWVSIVLFIICTGSFAFLITAVCLKSK
jgi:hypothetical protein